MVMSIPYLICNVIPYPICIVIPDLIRDPVHPADVCKGLWCTLDPGSSPGVTNWLWGDGVVKGQQGAASTIARIC